MSDLSPILPPPNANAPAAGPLPDAELDAVEAALPTLETLGDLAACLRIAQAAESRLEAFFSPDSRILNCLDPFGDAVQALWRLVAIRKSMVRLYKEIKSGEKPAAPPSGATSEVQPSGGPDTDTDLDSDFDFDPDSDPDFDPDSDSDFDSTPPAQSTPSSPAPSKSVHEAPCPSVSTQSTPSTPSTSSFPSAPALTE